MINVSQTSILRPSPSLDTYFFYNSLLRTESGQTFSEGPKVSSTRQLTTHLPTAPLKPVIWKRFTVPVHIKVLQEVIEMFLMYFSSL